MELDLLRTLIAVADSGGFTKAEQRIHRAQSTISQQIARLEQDLGRRLIDRNTRSMTLTHHGERFLNYARRMLELEEEAREALKIDNTVDVVRVGIPEDFAQFKLPALLRDFAAQQRHIVRIEIVSSASLDLTNRLKDGQLDLAIIKEGKVRSGALCSWEEELHWVVKRGSNLGAERPVPLVCFSRGCTYRNTAIATLESCRIPSRVMYESSNWLGVKAGVENGLGITLLSDLRGLSDVEELTEDQGFPRVSPSYLVVRSKQMPPRGAIASLAEKLIRLVPQERPVRTV